MARFENKYLVPKARMSELRDFLRSYINVDDFASRCVDNTYTVRSIYYDTSRLRYYNEKIEGLQFRKKLRIRGYDCEQDDSVIFLEIKRKRNSLISKNRAPVYFKNLSQLLETNDIETYAGLQKGKANSLANARKFFYHLNRHSLKPVVKVIYDREAYFYKFNRSLRITFDKNLRGSLFCKSDDLYTEVSTNYPLPEHFILEIKGRGSYPQWLQYIIGEMAFPLKALSKYTICIDSHRNSEPPIPFYNRVQ
ncbi:MAG: VTC domain-containing protein [Calditrichia bacterium]